MILPITSQENQCSLYTSGLYQEPRTWFQIWISGTRSLALITEETEENLAIAAFVVKFSTAREIQLQVFSLIDYACLISQTHYRHFI